MRKFLILGFGIILLGCESPVVLNSGQESRFKIGETTFSVSLPNGWTKQTEENQNEMIFNAVNNQDSFVILQRMNQRGNTPSTVFASARSDFFYFEEKSFSEKKLTFVFHGKIKNTSNLKAYYQKIIPIPNTDFFLLGSCASGNLESNNCEKLISGFKVVKDK